MTTWTRENMAWVAGLIEGEGSIGMQPGPKIQVAMTDKDVLDRLQELTGCGTVRGPYDWNQTNPQRKNFNSKPIYYWSCSAKQAYALLVALYPWFLSRRRERTLEVLSAYLKVQPHNASKTQCKRQHPFNEENTYIDALGRRHCRACRRVDAQRHRDKKKVA